MHFGKIQPCKFLFHQIFGPVKQCFTKGKTAHCVQPDAYSTPTDTHGPIFDTKLIRGKETDDKKIKYDDKLKSLKHIQVRTDRHCQ